MDILEIKALEATMKQYECDTFKDFLDKVHLEGFEDGYCEGYQDGAMDARTMERSRIRRLVG